MKVVMYILYYALKKQQQTLIYIGITHAHNPWIFASLLLQMQTDWQVHTVLNA